MHAEKAEVSEEESVSAIENRPVQQDVVHVEEEKFEWREVLRGAYQGRIARTFHSDIFPRCSRPSGPVDRDSVLWDYCSPLFFLALLVSASAGL